MAENRRCVDTKVRNVTLKEELEILRGEPIEVFDGNPMDIPCIETSDAEKLCKYPVVSVHMLAYNHEPYIRQAIEGVMMQKTDFVFELVIGEDCSQDKTREICFEYQKQYPDKIRVLWWHENVSKFGGNGRRVTARCRGEFIALCEGDDYWIDPLKLQKQVDVMRKYPSVGYCISDAKVKCEIPRDHPRLKHFVIKKWYDDNSFDFDMGNYKPGFVPREEFWLNRRYYPRTATVLFRKSMFDVLKARFEIFQWELKIGDALLWNAFPLVSDAHYLKDCTAVYRLNSGGVGFRQSIGKPVLYLDVDLVNLYFSLQNGETTSCIDDIVFSIFLKRVSIIDDIRGAANGNGDSHLQFVQLRKLLSTRRLREAIGRRGKVWRLYLVLITFGIWMAPSTFRHRLNIIRHPITYFKTRWGNSR